MLPVPRGRAAAILAWALLAAGAAGCARASAPGDLDVLLALVPAQVAAERVLYYTDLEAGAGGFGSVLPLGDLQATFGVDRARVAHVLESGGDPLTLLAGDVEPADVAEAAAGRGYASTEGQGGWVRFARTDAPAPGAGPLETAVPAGAARAGVLVLGSEADVDAVVGGAAPPAWGVALAQSLDEAAAVALDGRERPFAEAARRRDTDVAGLLAQHRVAGSLAGYQAAALTWDPEGEFDGRAAPAGVVALLLPAGVDGHEQAAALALRVATAPVLGERRRATSEVLEGGAPAFDPDLRVVRLPVRWRAFDPAVLRADLDAGHLLFLAPLAEVEH